MILLGQFPNEQSSKLKKTKFFLRFKTLIILQEPVMNHPLNEQIGKTETSTSSAIFLPKVAFQLSTLDTGKENRNDRRNHLKKPNKN
jgi:hypothetical protein